MEEEKRARYVYTNQPIFVQKVVLEDEEEEGTEVSGMANNSDTEVTLAGLFVFIFIYLYYPGAFKRKWSWKRQHQQQEGQS